MSPYNGVHRQRTQAARPQLPINAGRILTPRTRATSPYTRELHCSVQHRPHLHQSPRFRPTRQTIQCIYTTTHKPITFARKSKQPQANDQKTSQFPSYILQHKQWKHNLHLNYHEKLLHDDNSHNPLRRLELLKQSMWDVATTLQHDTPPQADSTGDELSWTMIFIRAAETINIRRMERAAAAYPFITTLIQAGDPNARIHPNFQALRNHAKELLQAQRSGDHQDQDAQHRKRQQLITRLARLIPGTTNNIGAILTDNDELATTPTTIAEALKKH